MTKYFFRSLIKVMQVMNDGKPFSLREDDAPPVREVEFLKSESEFLNYYLGGVGKALDLGEHKLTVLRDSSILVGYQPDLKVAFVRGMRRSFQETIGRLS